MWLKTNSNVSAPRPTLYVPWITLYGSRIYVYTNYENHNNGSFVEKYKIYSGSELVAEVDESISTFPYIDLSSIITTPGTHTVTVKASGTNFNDSVASNSIEYTVAAVSTVDVTCRVYDHDSEPSAVCYFKFGTAPTSASDYDFVFGNDTSDSTLAYLMDKATGTTESMAVSDEWTKSYTTSDIYVWGKCDDLDDYSVEFNRTMINPDHWRIRSVINCTYSSPIHLTVDANSTLEMTATVFQGSWD